MRSSFSMIFGSADSDDEVPRTIRISSLMYFRNLIRLKPVSARDRAEHDEDEQQAGHIHRRPSAVRSETSVPTP